jgi:ArsR family transcriptional regulator
MNNIDKDGICEVEFFHPEIVEKAMNDLFPVDMASNLSQKFKAIGHPARVRILSLLKSQELCVCDLSTILDLSVSTISHHLKELRNAGIVKFRTEGLMAFYSLEDNSITHHCLSSMQEMMSDQGA